MATKMELVLSPGNLGGESTDGGPFRNEDVREWSRVDRITGMLERARVETGRWRANTRDAAQSYGKMVDSRERNSADGSLVQKARRQVEIFQSQGVGGRSFQVVRASQWSSSKATDCALDDTVNKPSQPTQYFNGSMNGESNLNSRLSPRHTSLADQASDLEQLSSLCRQLHDEALSQSSFWPRLRSRSPSPPSIHIQESPEPSINIGAAERRSNSSEDLTSLAGGLDTVDEGFARDCRVRRSLQLASATNNNGETRPVAERARRFEEAAARPLEPPKPAPRTLLVTKTFGSIADNDFVKNDPNHPSKLLGQQLSKVSIVKDIAPSLGQTVHVSSSSSPLPRRPGNRTVVLLGADAEDEATHRVNVTAIKVEKEPVVSEYAILADASSATVPIKDDTNGAGSNGCSKPVKKVEFCKTEIHFAPDSGKVNIVETDGKPPPTNKFRRRRRNSSNSANGSGTAQQRSSLPLVHFGDTSYEKFIFGGQGRSPPQENPNITNDGSTIESKSNYGTAVETEARSDWVIPEKLREDIGVPIVREPNESRADAVVEKAMDHRHRGTHTTTVNFLNSENGPVSKLVEGDVTGLQLQLNNNNNNDNNASSSPELKTAVSQTTKITLRLQGSIGQTYPLRLSPFANLKSVRLVMSIGREPLDRLLLSTLCREELNAPWSLSLGSTEDSQDQGTLIQEKSSNPLFSPTQTSHITPKEITSQVAEKQAAQVVSKDSDNNQVLLKIVTTHKPTLARVENDEPTTLLARLRKLSSNLDTKSEQQQQSEISNLLEGVVRTEAKEHCDITAEIGSILSEQPTYENVFEIGTGAPVYENCRAAMPITTTETNKTVDEPPKKPRRQWKMPTRLNHEAIEGGFARSKPRSSRSGTPQSNTRGERSSSRTLEQPESKRVHRPSSRSSGSRDGSVRKSRETTTRSVKDDAAKAALARRKTGSRSETLERRSSGNKGMEKSNGSTRSKKTPVEVVYQTAVYNIKNEKLSKPTKVKEIKGPRLINELICGSKTKRPSDKKTVKTIVSQNTSKRKETPSAMKS